jgi:predicted Zn-dependent protease
MKRRHFFPIKSGCVLVLLCGFGLVLGCASDRQVIQQADQFHGTLKPAVMEDPVLAGYLQEVGDRIIDAAREMDQQHGGPKSHRSEDSSWMFNGKMKFHFVNSKTLNAFTTGGEHMYLYTGLFEQCKTEDELAAVMAHEFAHVYGRHVHKGMNRQYTALAIAAAGGGAGYALAGKDNRTEAAALGAGAGFALAQFANMGFTRKDEAEADKLGFQFYTRAGWDPQRFGDFFQAMIDKGYDKTPAMLSDHPTLASRVEAAQRRASELPPHAGQWQRPAVATGQRFKDLQARAARLGKTLPSDQTLANSQELLQALPRSCVAPVEPEDALQARERIATRAEAAQEKK